MGWKEICCACAGSGRTTREWAGESFCFTRKSFQLRNLCVCAWQRHREGGRSPEQQLPARTDSQQPRVPCVPGVLKGEDTKFISSAKSLVQRKGYWASLVNTKELIRFAPDLMKSQTKSLRVLTTIGDLDANEVPQGATMQPKLQDLFHVCPGNWKCMYIYIHGGS